MPAAGAETELTGTVHRFNLQHKCCFWKSAIHVSL